VTRQPAMGAKPPTDTLCRARAAVGKRAVAMLANLANVPAGARAGVMDDIKAYQMEQRAYHARAWHWIQPGANNLP
jgi:hypothetical protein